MTQELEDKNEVSGVTMWLASDAFDALLEYEGCSCPLDDCTHRRRMYDTKRALFSYIWKCEQDSRRLDVIEREAGRRIQVREEPDADICNIYLSIPGDPLGGGVMSSLRRAADKLLAEPSR